jgi:uncharacterized protein with GYD domain
MARYIALIKFTEKGAREIKKSTARAHSFNQAAAKSGVKIEGQYWTVGRFDGVLILSADQEKQALHCLAELAAEGAVQTQTMSAYTDKEFETIVGK